MRSLKGLFLTASSFDVCPSVDSHVHTVKLTWYCISSVLVRASRCGDDVIDASSTIVQHVPTKAVLQINPPSAHTHAAQARRRNPSAVSLENLCYNTSPVCQCQLGTPLACIREIREIFDGRDVQPRMFL